MDHNRFEELARSLAHLFDPVLAVHTSVIDPLPHRITAVYEEMLPRQPPRFLTETDWGAVSVNYDLGDLLARSRDSR